MKLLINHGLTGGEIKNAVIICLSEVADRSNNQRILQRDVLNAIKNVQKAKEEITGGDRTIKTILSI
jgi:hypothetical protein